VRIAALQRWTQLGVGTKRHAQKNQYEKPNQSQFPAGGNCFKRKEKRQALGRVTVLRPGNPTPPNGGLLGNDSRGEKKRRRDQS